MANQDTVKPSFLQARLARDHYLGLPLTTGILAVLCTAALFALVALHALNPGALPDLDQQIADWFHVRASSNLTIAVLAFTHLHGTIGILSMSALLAARLIRDKAWVWLLVLLVSVPGGMLFNYGLKFIFQRVRPQFDQPILVLHSYSFPSGHTIGAAVFYSVLAAWLTTQPAGAQRRLPIVAAAVALTVLTGLSRIYLGAHFFSDVIAAMLEGWGWFAFLDNDYFYDTAAPIGANVFKLIRGANKMPLAALLLLAVLSYCLRRRALPATFY